MSRKIYCVGCGKKVKTTLTSGAEIYPNRPDLKELPFWKCKTCNNYVGCHYKTGDPTRPLGVIPTPALRKARQGIHQLLDPLWRQGIVSRSSLYNKVGEALGYEYHTANIVSLEEAERVYRTCERVVDEILK